MKLIQKLISLFIYIQHLHPLLSVLPMSNKWWARPAKSDGAENKKAIFYNSVFALRIDLS